MNTTQLLINDAKIKQQILIADLNTIQAHLQFLNTLSYSDEQLAPLLDEMIADAYRKASDALMEANKAVRDHIIKLNTPSQNEQPELTQSETIDFYEKESQEPEDYVSVGDDEPKQKNGYDEFYERLLEEDEQEGSEPSEEQKHNEAICDRAIALVKDVSHLAPNYSFAVYYEVEMNCLQLWVNKGDGKGSSCAASVYSYFDYDLRTYDHFVEMAVARVRQALVK